MSQDLIKNYLELNLLFEKNNHSLFLVGGTVRDYLLGLPLTDMDVVTEATPDEIKEFLPEANFVFAKYGSVSYKDSDGVKFDITTLRKENSYEDSRHPGKIEFVKDLYVDVLRRDFTINGLYMDKDLKIIDYVKGQKDLKNHLLRVIGKPENRLKEDPLRIIRALRFAIDFDLTVEEELDKAIRANINLLENLNIEKIKQDIKKIRCSDKVKIHKYFEKYNIQSYVDAIE